MMEQQELLAGHVNKTHWNTVIIGGDVPHDELVQMISDSYDLIKPKVRRRIKDA